MKENMKKIAFYLNNKDLPDIDYKSIIIGNPGIGGSEYEFLLVSYFLEKRANNLDINLISNFPGLFLNKNKTYVHNISECCSFCVSNNIELVVIDIKSYDKNILDKFGTKLKFIIWAHNNISYPLLNEFFKTKYIYKIVNCGREELELYRDHLATLKSTFIYNIFPIKPKAYYIHNIADRKNHNVVYMGSLIPAKGFHILAKSWKQVLAKIPDAQLYIIGSGKLYNRNSHLGKYGIADENYEKRIIKFLVDESENILPSVHFLGLLGEDKYKILGNCKVAVPNPSGNTECLPVTVIEMQLMGCNITTIKHPAYYDTVMNMSYLFDKESKLADYIVARLKDTPDDYDDLYNFVFTKFNTEASLERWEDSLKNDSFCVEKISAILYHHKMLKDKLFRAKMKYTMLRYIPPIERFYDFWKYHILNIKN